MNFKKTILPNGTRLITVPMPQSPTVTIMILAEVGSKYETKNLSGISHFLEHSLFKGTARRPKSSDISRELDSLGAHYNAFTGQESTGYYAKAHKDKADKIVDIISDMYLNPSLPEAELNKEKGVIIQEINMYEDEPMRHVQDLFLELVYGDQPAGWNIAGTKESVASFSREEVNNYYRSHYVAPATVITLAGAFDEKKILTQIEKFSSQLPNEKYKQKLPVIESQENPKIKIKYKETDQAHLVLGVRAFGAHNPKAPILKVLSTVLGGGMSSRLFQKLRDELGLCYYVSASPDLYTDHGIFQISSGVDNAKISPAIKAIMEEMNKMKTEFVPEEELRKAKDFLIGNMYLSLESSDELAQFYAGQEIMRKKIRMPEAVALEIEKVTAEDIKSLANEIFRNESLNLAVVGPFSSEKDFVSLLNL